MKLTLQGKDLLLKMSLFWCSVTSKTWKDDSNQNFNLVFNINESK